MHIVHIGYPKTASTWLQTHLFPRLSSHRYVPDKLTEDILMKDSALGFDPEAARGRLDELGAADKPLVLSHEGLVGHMHSGGLFGYFTQGMAHRIHRVLPDAHILLLCRRQESMLATAYRQYIRKGGTHTPARYLYPGRHGHRRLGTARKVPLFCWDHLDYSLPVRLYEELFGRERVHVRPFEALVEAPEAFADDLCQSLGLERGEAPIEDRRENPALGAHLLRLGRQLNRLSDKSVADKTCLVNLFPNQAVLRFLLEAINIRPIAGRKLTEADILTDAIRADAADYFAAGNRWLAEAHGLPLERYGYPGL